MDSQDLQTCGLWCHMCGPGQPNCFVRCIGEDGVWKYVEGCPSAANNGVFGSKALCAKGNALLASTDQRNRLLYPQRRIGPKGPGARFERISWDAAFDQIAETLLSQKDAYGPESFGILSPQFYEVTAVLGRRFLNVHGSPNFLHSAICHVQRNASIHSVLGGPGVHMPNSTVPAQLDKTELLVCWGVNTENSGVSKGDPRRRLHEKARGMKIIDIRPACDPLASRADVWLPIRPGTDLALALAFLHVICAEGLYDHDFVENHCEGFEQLADHVRQFSPAWAQERCGIPSDQIVHVARMIAAADPCAIMHGNGIGDQSRDGHWTLVAIELIGALCGNLGKPGGGCDALFFPPLVELAMVSTLPENMPRSTEDEAHGWRAGTSKLVAPEFPRGYTAPGLPLNSSYHGAMRSIISGKPYPLRSLFAQATNPLSATRQPKLVAEALDKVDFFFSMDTFANPACDFADIVLPAALQSENAHMLGMRNGPAGTFLALGQKLVDPPGEAMSDWDFYLQLGCRMGYGDSFWHGSIDAYLQEQLAPSGFTLEELRAAPEGVFVPRGEKPASQPRNARDYEILFAALPNHKLQCVNTALEQSADIYGHNLLPGLPVYRGPLEGIAETPDLAKDYPLVFSDVHAHRLSQHSYYDYIGSLRRFEPDPWVKMHPDTAHANGIEEGNWVRIESPHGYCVLKAKLTRGIARDVLLGRRGWWQACPSLGLPGYAPFDGGAETSVLYANADEAADLFHSALGKQTLVCICKAEEPPVEYASNALVAAADAAGQGEYAPMEVVAKREKRTPSDDAVQLPGGALQQDGFVFTPDLCIKCYACEVACQQWHGLPEGWAGFRIIVEEEQGDVPNVKRLFSTQRIAGCDLCRSVGGQPRCSSTCPTGALV